jgi:isoquinoline 1-oxidoreductase subunit alpha
MLDETDRSMIVQSASKKPADAATIKLKVNGKPQTVEVSPDTPLLWVLRETLGLTGTKFGCGMALCGACTVHLNGEAVRSCVTPISRAAGKDVTTIEGLKDELGHALQSAWIAEDVPQCGYCQSGQIMSAAVLLRENSAPTDDDIDDAMTGNICRCGTYQRIRRAIHLAAQMKAGHVGEFLRNSQFAFRRNATTVDREDETGGQR